MTATVHVLRRELVRQDVRAVVLGGSAGALRAAPGARALTIPEMVEVLAALPTSGTAAAARSGA